MKRSRRHQAKEGGKREKITPQPSQAQELVTAEIVPGKKEPVEKSANLKKKLLKLPIPDINNYEGALGEWFDIIHERSNPSVSKFERGEPYANIEKAEGNPWALVKEDISAIKLEKGKGPIALVISSSADRACEIFKKFKSCPFAVSKLFSRHMKVQEQAEFLEANRVGVAVGTPNRVLKLSEDGFLKLESLKYLIIDMHLDMKSFSVLTLPGVSEDFYKFYREFILPQEESPKIILLF